MNRFGGLRRRLSYANVMATVALFFALSGSAMAVGKYLVATDVIATGDMAGSTYESPVIADGKITTSKFASTATAPDASKLGGRAATDYPTVVARGSIDSASILDPGREAAFELIVPGIDRTTDYVVVNPANPFSALTINGSVLTLTGVGDRLSIFVSNGSSRPETIGTLRYLVLR